jgi:hypothetical protein
MLNLFHINSKFHSVLTFVIIDVQTIFHTEFSGMSMMNLHTKFQTSNSSSLLDTAIKQKTKCKLHATAMSFYTIIITIIIIMIILIKRVFL